MRRALAGVAIAIVSGACSGEVSLPPHGEALVVVDTDLPVPQLAARLRVDLYAEDGKWIESRDIGRSDPRDWPASFSVFSDDDTRERLVLVRLRVYPEGAVRDYRGERFEPRPEFEAPVVPSMLADLCAKAPELPIGGRVTQRRGETSITDFVTQAQCRDPSKSGAVAARVTISTAGQYRFDVAGMVPYEGQATLYLRARCDDSTTQLACADARTAAPSSSGHFPRFDATLQPGTYFLFAGGTTPNWPADVTLEALPVDTLPPTAQPAPPPAPSLRPRLVRGDRDVTPSSEPVPGATVDRLVLLKLVPGVRGRARATLRGACEGTQAKLGADSAAPEPRAAATCIDQENVRVPVREEPLEPDMTRPTDTVRGSFPPPEPCETPIAGNSSPVCVPGGAFVLGARAPAPFSAGIGATDPERVAVMPRFWIDRYEVSVARFRAALERGLALDPTALKINDAPFDPSDLTTESACTFSTTPMGREDLPLTCVAWPLARAFCKAEGGDLPTEAQWEYVTRAAGRSFEAPHPWGSEDATCDRATWGRSVRSDGSRTCVATGSAIPTQVGPAPVTAHDGSDGQPGDVSPLGVVGLGGGVGEWTLDAAEGYASACWRAAPLRAPACLDEHAPFRAARGSSWTSDVFPAWWRIVIAGGQGPSVGVFAPLVDIGFRCAYAQRPRP